MKARFLPLAILAAAATLPVAAQAQSLTVALDFEDTTMGTTVSNAATGPNFNPAGNLTGTGAIGFTTDAQRGNIYDFGTEANVDGSGYLTPASSFTLNDSGFGGTGGYTGAGWVQISDSTGDRMLFGGSNAENTLHLGFRDGNVHSGHWGNDSSDGTVFNEDEWAFVAWRYDATNQTQTQYYSVAGSTMLENDVNPEPDPTAGPGGPLAIGLARTDDDRDFDGLADNVSVHSRQLSDTEVLSMFQLSVTEGQQSAGNFTDVPGALGYSPDEIDSLLEIHLAGSGSAIIDNIEWTYSDTIDTGTFAGGLYDDGNGGFVLSLAGSGTAGTGLVGTVVPEPASLALWSLVGLGLFGGYRWRRRRQLA